MNWLKKYKWVVAAVVIIIAFAAYSRASSPQTEYQEYTVENKTVRDTLELSGRVTAETMATLRFPAGGMLTYVGAKKGESVKKWQTVASIDSRQLQKTLEQKLNLYAIARGNFEQTIDDRDNSVPDGDLGRELKRLLESNQYSLENTVKDVEYLDLSLRLTRLSSPIAGILISAPTNVSGIQVGPTDAWVVVDPTSLYFSADLDETDLSRVSTGQDVTITLDAYDDQSYPSTISAIGFTPKETTSGTVYEIKVMIPEAKRDELRLGLGGVAAVTLTQKDNVATLPASAVTFEGDATYVYVMEGGKYVRRDIEVGIENEGLIEIISGLSQGDRVYAEKTN